MQLTFRIRMVKKKMLDMNIFTYHNAKQVIDIQSMLVDCEIFIFSESL